MIHRSFFYLFSLIAAGMLLVACGGAEPTPTPTATTPPAQPTFTPTAAAQAPAAALPTPLPTAVMPTAMQNTPAAFALPAPLYYIDPASGQIMRMERDATTVMQLTTWCTLAANPRCALGVNAMGTIAYKMTLAVPSIQVAVGRAVRKAKYHFALLVYPDSGLWGPGRAKCHFALRSADTVGIWPLLRFGN